MSSFVALDVETANSDYASICSIGAARFERGAIVDEFYTLVDPQDYFAAVNVGIHGIDRDKVARAPRFAEVLPRLNEFVADSVVVHHTQFDRSAISQAAARANLPPPSWRWLDSALVTRRTWPHRSRDGYGLAEVCRMIGYRFAHHDALADAKAAGHVILAAMRKIGARTIEPIIELERAPARPPTPAAPRSTPAPRSKPAKSTKPAKRTQATKPAEPTKPTERPKRAEADVPAAPPSPTKPRKTRKRRLRRLKRRRYDETVVVSCTSLVAPAALQIVARRAGLTVGSALSEETTLLIVADETIEHGADGPALRDRLRADELIAAGHKIDVISESEFFQMLGPPG